MENINKSRHSRYILNLHIVWLPKYRRPVLAPYRDELCGILKDVAAEKGYAVLAVEVMPDHVHLFVSVPPTAAPCEVVKTFKGQSGRKLLKAHPELGEKSYRGSLWSHSYFVCSAGSVSAETIQRYIEGQYE